MKPWVNKTPGLTTFLILFAATIICWPVWQRGCKQRVGMKLTHLVLSLFSRASAACVMVSLFKSRSKFLIFPFDCFLERKKNQALFCVSDRLYCKTIKILPAVRLISIFFMTPIIPETDCAIEDARTLQSFGNNISKFTHVRFSRGSTVTLKLSGTYGQVTLPQLSEISPYYSEHRHTL